jgi:hypothetical protein
MKAIDRRLRMLQDLLAPQENDEVVRLVELLRARRRRRLETSAEPFEERTCKEIHDQDRPLSVADILRMGRRRAVAPNESPSDYTRNNTVKTGKWLVSILNA